MEQEVVKIRRNLKVAQDREFIVGDHVYLRVRENKSSLKLGSCAKMPPRYCGPFEVLERIGTLSCI